jgi:hypothetical protein
VIGFFIAAHNMAFVDMASKIGICW